MNTNGRLERIEAIVASRGEGDHKRRTQSVMGQILGDAANYEAAENLANLEPGDPQYGAAVRRLELLLKD
jgi:hypothetical protein